MSINFALGLAFGQKMAEARGVQSPDARRRAGIVLGAAGMTPVGLVITKAIVDRAAAAEAESVRPTGDGIALEDMIRRAAEEGAQRALLASGLGAEFSAALAAAAETGALKALANAGLDKLHDSEALETAMRDAAEEHARSMIEQEFPRRGGETGEEQVAEAASPPAKSGAKK